MSPSATNRITIIASPGKYNFGTSTFTMDTQYIDLVSLDGNRSIIFNAPLNESNRAQGSISITADNVYLKGVNVLTKGLDIGGDLTSLVIENSKGGDRFIVWNDLDATLKGTFINCEGGNNSFESNNNRINATFINCIGGDYSFFSYDNLEGTFENCEGGDASFRANKGKTDAIFSNCIGGDYSFDSTFGDSNTVCNNCIGGEGSFSGEYRLYYCRLTSGTFDSATGLGLTVLCIDGNNEINNQAVYEPPV
jgi:hypothetical protein